MFHSLLCCYYAMPISCICLNSLDICYEDLHSLRKDTLLDLQLKLVLRTTSSVSVLSCILGGFEAPNPIECLQDEPASTSITMSLPSRITKRLGADPEEWKRGHEFGRRSLVETVFGMMKLRYGGSLSSRGGWRGGESC